MERVSVHTCDFNNGLRLRDELRLQETAGGCRALQLSCPRQGSNDPVPCQRNSFSLTDTLLSAAQRHLAVCKLFVGLNLQVRVFCCFFVNNLINCHIL